MTVHEPYSSTETVSNIRLGGTQTEKAHFPNCVLVRQTTADLVDDERS